jgi:hypothetical protein
MQQPGCVNRPLQQLKDVAPSEAESESESRQTDPAVVARRDGLSHLR